MATSGWSARYSITMRLANTVTVSRLAVLGLVYRNVVTFLNVMTLKNERIEASLKRKYHSTVLVIKCLNIIYFLLEDPLFTLLIINLSNRDTFLFSHLQCMCIRKGKGKKGRWKGKKKGKKEGNKGGGNGWKQSY